MTEIIASDEFCVCILGHFIIRIDKIKPKYENKEIFKLDTRDPERRGKGYFFSNGFPIRKGCFSSDCILSSFKRQKNDFLINIGGE